MSKCIIIPQRFQEEGSDTLSTSTPISRIGSPGRNYNRIDDSMGSKSKKIRKKRSAYQKIDDDIRVKLLEAVQQNGETLKSAAKRYGINYSSAKSILHTYRKEGRILKKSAQDRNIKKRTDSLSNSEFYPDMPATPTHTNYTPPSTYSLRHGFRHNLRIDTTRYEMQVEKGQTPEKVVSPSSPINNLSEKFGNMFQFGRNGGMTDMSQFRSQKYMKSMGQNSNTQFPKSFPKLTVDTANLSNFLRENPEFSQVFDEKFQQREVGDQSLDSIRGIDTFYMNYSNSPLSSEKILRDGSPTVHKMRKTKEFDSFGDMISALQHKNSDEIKEEKKVYKQSKFSIVQNVHDQEGESPEEEQDSDWKGTIENAAIDTFRTVVDAQLLLCDALKKASFLNNLVQLQKEKEQDKCPEE